MNSREMSAKGGSASGGETKDTCCPPWGGRHKRKIVIIILAVVLAFAVLAIAACAKKIREERNFSTATCTSGLDMRNGMTIGKCGPRDVVDPFYPPADAAKKGELTVIAADSNHVTQAVTDIAAKSSGAIMSTKISYAANGIKQGAIVIQISADKFESVFGDLRAMGARVLSETTEIIPQNNIVYPMSATVQNAPADGQQDQNTSENESPATGTAVAQPTIYPPFSRNVQDKGYIRILFSDNGKNWGDGMARTRTITINSDDFVLILGHNLLKGSLLILLIAILLWFVKKLNEIKAKTPVKKTTIPASKKVAVKKTIAVKRSKVVRRR
jgi:hypothetical protein